MDNQLALMKKLQKDHDTIAYAHNEEIVLIKRVVGDDGTRLLEVMLNSENGISITRTIFFAVGYCFVSSHSICFAQS